MGSSRIINTEIAVKEGKEIHSDKYDYSLTEYINCKTPLVIICPIHGAFKQRVEKHFLHGCPKCGEERTASKTRKIPKELVKLSRNVKRSIKSFIKRQGYSKKSNTYQILGASWEELKNHLENNSYGFTIYCDDINIDHIIPLATIKEESDIYTLNHYSNLQLLPKEYNQHIKKDKPFNKKHFESWLNETNYNKC